MMQKYCDRCNKITIVLIMSMFNTENLCLDCKEKEEKHPDYKRAVLEEFNAVKNGDYNFKGIGLPDNLKN